MHVGKIEHCLKRTIKQILVRDQKEKKRAIEKASIFLGSPEAILNRTLVEIRLVRTILTKS